MDEKSAQQWWAIVSASPPLTILAVVVLIGVIWKLVDWAYALKMDGLKEQIAARGPTRFAR